MTIDFGFSTQLNTAHSSQQRAIALIKVRIPENKNPSSLLCCLVSFQYHFPLLYLVSPSITQSLPSRPPQTIHIPRPCHQDKYKYKLKQVTDHTHFTEEVYLLSKTYNSPKTRSWPLRCRPHQILHALQRPPSMSHEHLRCHELPNPP